MNGRTIRHTRRTAGSHDWLLIYTLRGAGLYRFKGGEFASRPHDLTLYRPGAFQDYQWSPAAAGWDLLYIHFLPRPGWLEWLNWPRVADGLMRLHLEDAAIRRRVIRRLEEMIQWFRGSQSRRRDFGVNALEEVLLWCDSVNPRQADSQTDARVRRVMETLSQEPEQPFSEDRLARLAGLSGSRLRHLFAAQTGRSMRDFQEERRLEQARQLLALSSRTISEISESTGFSNPFYFSLRFKKHTGESPRAFRQRVIREAH